MPNWTYNDVTIRGTKKQIDDFYKKYILGADGKEGFDFNKVIPQPRTEEECPKNCIRKDGDPIEVLQDRPWFNWYEWNCKYWGTKWNACDVDVDKTDTRIFLSFSTAWAAPRPVLNKLIEQNKGMSIEIDWEDEC